MIRHCQQPKGAHQGASDDDDKASEDQLTRAVASSRRVGPAATALQASCEVQQPVCIAMLGPPAVALLLWLQPMRCGRLQVPTVQ